MPLPGFGTGTKMWGKGRGGKAGYWDSNPPLLIIESPMAIYKYIHTLGHKLGTTKFEMENIFYITLFSC
jgi:hypothetical protein